MAEESEFVAEQPAQAAPEGVVDARPVPRWVYLAGGVVLFFGTFVVGWKSSPALASLLLAAIAILAVVGFLFRTVQNIASPPVDDEAEEIAPTQAEDAKRAALKALRDLEWERGIGNVTQEDYEKLLEKYRAEAKRAMRVVDEERKESRARAEKLVAQQLAAFGPKKTDDEEGDENTGDEPSNEAAASKEPTSRECPKCSTANDADAVFCKKCGNDLSAKSGKEGSA